MDRIPLKNKIIFFSLVFFISAFSLITLIIIPVRKKIKDIKSNIEIQYFTLEKNYRKSKSVKETISNLKSIEPEIDDLNKIFLNESLELEFITQMEDLAQRNNILQEIKLNKNPLDEKKGYRKVDLIIQCQGEYNNLLKYLSDLENSEYYINLFDIELNSPRTENKDKSKGLTMSIKAIIFSRD